MADLSWSPDGSAIAGYLGRGGRHAFMSKQQPTKIILVPLRR